MHTSAEQCAREARVHAIRHFNRLDDVGKRETTYQAMYDMSKLYRPYRTASDHRQAVKLAMPHIDSEDMPHICADAAADRAVRERFPRQWLLRNQENPAAEGILQAHYTHLFERYAKHPEAQMQLTALALLPAMAPCYTGETSAARLQRAKHVAGEMDADTQKTTFVQRRLVDVRTPEYIRGNHRNPLEDPFSIREKAEQSARLPSGGRRQ